MPENTTNNMMDSLFNSDPTEFEEPPFHLITTDHPYMASLGLSAFTTGTLYRWWNKKDGAGNYINQKYFFGKSPGTETVTTTDPETGEETEEERDLPNEIQSTIAPIDILLGVETDYFGDKQDKGVDQFSFLAWRKEGDQGAGRYVKKYIDGGHIDEWSFVQQGENAAGKPRNYSYNDLAIDPYKNLFAKEDLTLDGSFQVPDGKGGKEDVTFEGISPITETIVLNDFVRDFELNEIDESTWDQEKFARYEFIQDILASKNGYIEWSGKVPFKIQTAQTFKGDPNDPDAPEPEPAFVCERADWVKFKMFLYSNNNPKRTDRNIALASPTFAGPPVDPLGRPYGNREDGRFSAFPEGSQAAEVAAEIDLTYNEYTGKWESGSKQMVGVVTQTIRAAQVIGAARLETIRPEDMLDRPTDPNSHIIFGSGAAMPLNMQNGNPMQWTPNYKQPNEVDEDGKFSVICPEEDSVEKATFRVFNASTKPLETDQMVLLNNIDGQWFAIDFPSGVDPDGVAAGFEGKWEFQYLATNAVFFQRDQDFKSVGPVSVEQGFHSKFYKFDPLNSGTYLNSKGEPNYDIEKLWMGGFHQFSSFDFMDKFIGGTRLSRGEGETSGNALSVTNPTIDPLGEEIPFDEGQGNGLDTGIFFGCIFPDGYDSINIQDIRATSKDFWGSPSIVQSGYNANYKKFLGLPRTSNTINGEVIDWQFFNQEGSNNVAVDSGVDPFGNGSARSDPRTTYRNTTTNSTENMFAANDDVFSHLPADIALNAAPNGENGQPLRNVAFTDSLYFGGVTSTIDSMSLWHQTASEAQNWITKMYPSGTAGVLSHMDSSFFDLKPKRPNRIMFRPLKAEAYSQFIASYNPQAALGGPPGTRSAWGWSAAEQMGTRFQPASYISAKRSLDYDIALFDQYRQSFPGVAGNYYGLWNSYWGLRLNIDIPLSDAFDPPVHKLSAKAKIAATSRFREDAWGLHANEVWCHGGGDAAPPTHAGIENWFNIPWRQAVQGPAGAFGIIGAYATCSANSEIEMTTNQVLGTWSWAFTAGIGKVYQEAAWGKGNSSSSPQSINLYSRVMQSHPREQTIFDPRYLAVHHFNPGILQVDPRTGLPVIDKVEKEVSHKLKDGPQLFKYNIDVDIQPDDRNNYFAVDVREPSVKVLSPVKDAIHRPITLPEMSYCYSDGAFNLENTEWHETLPSNQWNVNGVRRGKLLPFFYEKKTIGCQIFKGANWSQIDDVHFIRGSGGIAVEAGNLDGTGSQVTTFGQNVTDDVPRNFYPTNVDLALVVRDKGLLYKEGDSFTVNGNIGLGLLAKVRKVDDEGAIVALDLVSSGTNFQFDSFAPSGSPITRNSSIGVRLVNGGDQPSEKGTGFNAFIPFGRVIGQVELDEKPQSASDVEFERLTLDANAESDKDPDEGDTSPFGVEQGTKTITVQIPDERKSTDSKYDIFLRMQNDVSHTFLKGDWKSSVSRFPNIENYVDLTITTK